MILMLVIGSTVLGHFIAITGIPQAVADWVAALDMNRYAVLSHDLPGVFDRRVVHR